jgi:hypothetical protein
MRKVRAPLPHVREVIDAQGRQYPWLAEKCGVSYALLMHILAGRRTMAQPTAQRMADTLGIPLAFIWPDTLADFEPKVSGRPMEAVSA